MTSIADARSTFRKLLVLFFSTLALYSCDKQVKHSKEPATNSGTNFGLYPDICPPDDLYITKTAYDNFIDVGLCTLIIPMITCKNGRTPFASLKFEEPIELKSSSIDGSFYLDDRCTQPLTKASIDPGGFSQYFYKDSYVGPVTLTISNNGSLGLSSQSRTFTMTPITSLVFTTPALNQKISYCGNLSLEARNVAGTAQSQSSPLKIRLWSTSITGEFFSDKECTLPIPSQQVTQGLLRLAPNLEYSLELAAGQTTIPNIYYRDTTPGSIKLNAISTESASASVEMKITISP